ncbi:MAG: hypothetical protein WAR79_06485 [Melioribacteraceae bacterium]
MKKRNKNILVYFLFIYCLCNLIISAQQNIFPANQNTFSTFSLRNSNYFSSSIFYNNFGANRFSANPSISTLDNWNSLHTKVVLNDLPINISILGFNSLDFLPIDILTHEISQEDSTNSLFNNSINISSKKYSDSLEFSLRSFLGGETGDPLIHIFTRPELSHTNKNKIIPSAVFNLKNSIENFYFKISGGYFGYFSTGSVNDAIMYSKSKYYYGKQNKQFLGSGEFNYKISDNKSVDLKLNYMSYYGWDIPPFINSFIHFENYFHRIQLSLNNIVENFTFMLKKDGQLVNFNKTEIEKEISSSINEYSFFTFWNKKSDKNILSISADINNISTKNEKTNQQNLLWNYFTKEINEYVYNVNVGYRHSIFNRLKSEVNVNYKNHYLKSSISMDLKLDYEINSSNKLILCFTSFVNYPKEVELFGNYLREYTSSENQFKNVSMNISNENLLYERRINSGIKYFSNPIKNFTFEIIPLFEIVKDPIELRCFGVDRDYFTKEIIISGGYSNGNDKSAISIYNNLNYKISENANINCEYKFTDNTEVVYSPKHKSKLELDYQIPLLGLFKLNWIYQSSTRWKNFDVSKNDLSYINDFSAINFYYNLILRKFYFVENLELTFAIENLFNEEIKYLPIGNILNRTIIFSLNANL